MACCVRGWGQSVVSPGPSGTWCNLPSGGKEGLFISRFQMHVLGGECCVPVDAARQVQSAPLLRCSINYLLKEQRQNGTVLHCPHRGQRTGLLTAALYSTLPLLLWPRPSYGIFPQFVFCEGSHRASKRRVCAYVRVWSPTCICFGVP